jgi:hypothetical protein
VTILHYQYAHDSIPPPPHLCPSRLLHIVVPINLSTMDLAGDTACTTRTEEDKQQVIHANQPLPSCLGPNRAHNINIQHCRTHYVITIFCHRGTFHHHLFLKHQNINVHSTVPNTIYKYDPLRHHISFTTVQYIVPLPLQHTRKEATCRRLSFKKRGGGKGTDMYDDVMVV